MAEEWNDEKQVSYVESWAQEIFHELQDTGGYWYRSLDSAIYRRVDELWAESGETRKLEWRGDDDAVGAVVVDG